jgi:iron complex outermembrane receptor protein
MSQIRRSRTGATRAMSLMCGASAAVLAAFSAAAANAQSQPTADSAGSGAISEVVVTGSLISRKNYVAASPIVVTSAETLKQSGALSLETVLNQLPEFSPSGTSGNGGQGTGGHATVNLHGLGSNRNLVLLDGRRLPLADIFGDVDINLIPDSILSGVDTITGGASAVYGSDAMSGVVNFRTLTNFEGVKADVQYGNSFKADYQQVSASVALGARLNGDKGHLLLSLGYTDRASLAGSARSFFNLVTPSSFIGQGTFVPSATNLPNQAVVNGLFAGYGATTPVSNTLNLGFNDDGSLFTQTGAKNYKGPTSNGYAVIAGNVRMPVGPQTIIENPLVRKSLFSKFDYALTPDITAYGQVLYVDSDVQTSSGKSLTQFGVLTTVPITNPFIPTDLRTLLASRANPNAPFTWNGRYVGLPAKSWDEHYTTSQFLGGLRGELPKGWTWDAFGSYDDTNHLQSNYNAVLKSQVQLLLNAADGGASLCAGGFDPFGVIHSTAISQACQNFMTTTAHSTEKLTQTQGQAVIQGPVFHLPAGDVHVALLGDIRNNTYRYQPDPQLAAQNIEAVIASAPSHGSIGVKEVAGQIDIPVLRDLPLISQLDVGAAYRYSDYTTSGGVSSYEADARWRPVPTLLIRGSYQRAVRAPNIGELFSAASGSQIAFGTPPASIGDPCDVRSTARTGANGAQVRTLCLAQGMPAAVIDNYQFPTTATAGLAQGNPNLHPEVATTYNLGLAWTSNLSSPLLSGLSASVDYYNISIAQVISVVPGLTALSKCYNLDGSNPTYSPTNTFCALLQRDSNGLLQVINTPYLNLGSLKTEGIDIQLNWSTELSDVGLRAPGKIYANTGIGYIRHFTLQTLPNSKPQDFVGTNTINGGAGALGTVFPRWKALTTVGYQVGGMMVGLRWRYMAAMKDVTSVTTPATPGVGVPAYNLFDLIGSYEFNHKWLVRAGVTNLANRGLPVVASSQTSTDPATFDAVGRSYYLGLSVAF